MKLIELNDDIDNDGASFDDSIEHENAKAEQLRIEMEDAEAWDNNGEPIPVLPVPPRKIIIWKERAMIELIKKTFIHTGMDLPEGYIYMDEYGELFDHRGRRNVIDTRKRKNTSYWGSVGGSTAETFVSTAVAMWIAGIAFDLLYVYGVYRLFKWFFSLM